LCRRVGHDRQGATTMLARTLLRLALPIVLTLIVASIFDALAAANSVGVTAADDLRVVIDANALRPPECAALNLAGVVVGSGTIYGGGSNALILGSAGADTIRGQGGNDCIIGGGGNDDLRGGGGTEVLIGGPGADTLNGGSGGDICYGYSGAVSGGEIDTFLGCETQFP
jgi:Ca2+-binding RTX toxin-like protein